MPEKYVRAGLAVVIDALAVTVVTAVLALMYWLVTGATGQYLTIVADMLFVEGGVILTFGALVSFFKFGGTQDIRRLIYNPVLPFERLGFLRAAGKNKEDEEPEAGWPLIFIGALLIVFSFLTTINYLI